MRFVVAGAGAIGTYIGCRLAYAGEDVTLFGRGPHLQAMRAHGVTVRTPDGTFHVQPKVTDTLAEIGQADVVFLGVKAHGLPQLAPHLRSLFGPDTVVVSTQNGIPWWYFQNHGGDLEGLRLERVDPGGVISGSIEPRRVVGAIVYFSTVVPEPGVVELLEGNRISLGEPDGTRSDRCRQIAAALISAGLRSPITTRIRHEIWVKLLGNASFNPISALTRATLGRMLRDPDVTLLVRAIMAEVESVAARLGVELPVSIDQRIAGAAKAGEHKTSMLQDLEAGRPLELEAIVGAVLEIADRVGEPMPHTRAVYACAKLLGLARAAASACQLPVVEPARVAPGI